MAEEEDNTHMADDWGLDLEDLEDAIELPDELSINFDPVAAFRENAVLDEFRARQRPSAVDASQRLKAYDERPLDEDETANYSTESSEEEEDVSDPFDNSRHRKIACDKKKKAAGKKVEKSKGKQKAAVAVDSAEEDEQPQPQLNEFQKKLEGVRSSRRENEHLGYSEPGLNSLDSFLPGNLYPTIERSPSLEDGLPFQQPSVPYGLEPAEWLSCFSTPVIFNHRPSMNTAVPMPNEDIIIVAAHHALANPNTEICYFHRTLYFGIIGFAPDVNLPKNAIGYYKEYKSDFREISNGYTSLGFPATIMCKNCTHERLYILTCPRHIFKDMEFVDDEEIDASLAKYMDGDFKGGALAMATKFCSVCLSYATVKCCADEDRPEGYRCTLALCDTCYDEYKKLLMGHRSHELKPGQLVSELVKHIESNGWRFELGVRADTVFLTLDGELARRRFISPRRYPLPAPATAPLPAPVTQSLTAIVEEDEDMEDFDWDDASGDADVDEDMGDLGEPDPGNGDEDDPYDLYSW